MDGQAVNLGSPHQRSVLAMLLLEPGQLVPVSRLASVLWGEEPPASAVKNLQGHIHRLRRALAAAPGVTLRTSGSAYALQVSPDEVDLHRFRRMVRTARTVEPPDAADLLGEALALWTGPALADLTAPAVRAVAERLDEERLVAQEQLAQVRMRLGRHAECAAELSRLVDAHPLREQTWALLMLALFRCGRRAEALAQYRTARNLLSEELGVEPGADLREMQQRILRDDPALQSDPAHPADAAARSNAPTSGRRTPPADAPARRAPAELPHAARGFSGRQGELAELDGLLALFEDPARSTGLVAALDGMGGVGKTALVLHWAQRVRDRFPEGVLHADLRGHDAHRPPLAPGEALAQLLRSLGLPAADIPAETDERARLYRSLLAGGRRLLVLDNAVSAAQVRPLLPGDPGCLTLVTSRTCLRGLLATEGAHRLSLRPLPPGDSRHLLRQVVGADRVDADPEAAQAVADFCGHLPLALRIAAAQLLAHPERGLDALAADLSAGDRIAALGVDDDPEADLRSALDLSYRGLSAQAATLLRRLGGFPGTDLDVPAAAALCGGTREETADLLAELTTAHLVEEQIPGRYALHDLVRLHAARLGREDAPAERAAARGRLLLWYLAGTRHACRILGIPRLLVPDADWDEPPAGGPQPQTPETAGQWLETERANMVAVICQGADRQDGAPGWHLALELRGFFRLRRYTADWTATATRAAQEAAQSADPRTRAALAHNLGHAHWSAGRYAEALHHYRQALAESERAAWHEGQGASLSALGAVHHENARADEAISCYRRALAVIGRDGSGSGGPMELITVGSLGLVYQSVGRLADAVECFGRVLAISEGTGARDLMATSLGNLGQCHQEMGDLRRARDTLTRALALYREVGSRNGEANVLTGLAVVSAETGDRDDAAYRSALALRLARDIGDRRIECDALAVSGLAAARRGDLAAASWRFKEAMDLAEQTGYGRGLPLALTELGAVRLREERLEQAAQLVRRAVTLARTARHRPDEARALTVLAGVQLARGDYDGAARHARSALALHRHLGRPLGEARACEVLGDIVHAVQGAAGAEPHWRQALRLYEQTGSADAHRLRQALEERLATVE